jgi:hypothetical protein
MKDDLRLLKFANLYTFHRAAIKFHTEALGMTSSLKKQLKGKSGK